MAMAMAMATVWMCNTTVYEGKCPWFSLYKNTDLDERPYVYTVFPRCSLNSPAQRRPFKVYGGETVYIRDDGSLSLPFAIHNRILFPTQC